VQLLFPTSRKDFSCSMELQHQQFVLFWVCYSLSCRHFVVVVDPNHISRTKTRLESNLFLALKPFYFYSSTEKNVIDTPKTT